MIIKTDIQKIVKKYRSGKLENNNDEKYAGGFWDLAGDIAYSYRNKVMNEANLEDLQETIYYALTDLYRETK